MEDFSQMTSSQRVAHLIKKEKIFSQADLARLVGVKPPTVSEMLKKEKELPNKYLNEIAKEYKVSPNWLLSGEGEIFSKNPDSSTNTENQKGYARQQENNSFSEESNIGNNKAASNLVNFKSAQNENEHKTDALAFPEINEADYSHLPFIPVSARASFVDNFPDMNFESMSTFPVYNLDARLKKKNPVIIEVNGDSMEPQLKNKSKVLALPVDPGDWQYLINKIIAIVFDNQFTIKRISENTISRESGELVLKADNGGATLAVPAAAIRQVWQVVKVVDAEVE